MADTASLVVRVKAEGAEQAAKGLDNLSKSATTADKSTVAFTKSADAGGAASSSFGSKAQQASYQMQDMVVQLQSGTSAFVAIGQQVPQFLGAFGPVGAVTGTVVALASAIGGVLYKSMGDATAGAEELKEANEQLEAVLGETDYGVVGLTESLLKLAQTNEVAARSQISLALVNTKVAADAAAQSIQTAATAVDGWTNATGDFATATSQLDDLEKITKQFGITSAEAFNGDIPAKYQMDIAELGTFINTLGKEYDITSAQALELVKAQDAFNKQPTAETAQALATTMTEITDSSSGANSEFIRLNAEVARNAQIMIKAAGDAEALKAAQEGLKSSVEALSVATRQQNAELIESLRIQTLSGAEQVNAQAEQRKRQIDENEAFNAEEKAQAKAHIDTMAQQQIAAIEKREAIISAKADAALSKQVGRNNKSLQADADKRAAEEERAQQYLEKLERDNMSELELIGEHEQDKLDKVNEFRAQGLIDEQEHQDAITEIQRTAAQTRADLEYEAAKQIEEANQKLFDAEMRAKEEKEKRDQEVIDKGIEAHREMTSQLKSILGENNDLYKAAALTQIAIDTQRAAIAAYAAGSAVPVAGVVLGPLAAGAAVAYGAAAAAEVVGAREQGGSMTGGSAYQMAERGKAEVIVPAGNSRAKTIDQMNEMMGGKSSSPANIVIVNQTTGRIDSVQQEQTDEEIRIIVREEMVNQTVDQSSPYAKARRSTRDQPGY